MPGDAVWFGFVVEGKGEVDAIPFLIRRICSELFGIYPQTTRPVRLTKSKLVQAGELERAIRFAKHLNLEQGPVLVVLDADDDCPAILGPSLRTRALTVTQNHAISIVIP